MVDVLLVVGEQVPQEAERLHRHLHLSVRQQSEHLQSKNALTICPRSSYPFYVETYYVLMSQKSNGRVI